MSMILSGSEALKIEEAVKSNLDGAEVSLDLGISKAKVGIKDGIIVFPGGIKVEAGRLKKVIKDDASCFLVRDGSFVKIQLFSGDTNRFYKLVPTKDAPTVEISGIRMHATKNMAPMEDTRKKLESIAPVKGNVLDTCMGLGYTAIAASKSAEIVMAFERDENIIEMARVNPWSKELFGNKGISITKGDVFEGIKALKSCMFDIAIHDPPRLSLSTLLYSQEFYMQLHRVLRPRGRLYHYTGSPGSRNRNVDLAGNAAKRLAKAGFAKVRRVHYGVAAEKE